MTRVVKARTLDMPTGVNYNVAVSTARILGHLALVLSISIPAISVVAGCEKKSGKADPGPGTAKPGSNGGSSTTVEVDTTPLPGFDATKLDADKQQAFYRLVGSLNSPCGKSENLRVSFTKDTSCKRAPFAVRLVHELLDDELPEDKTRELYEKLYTQRPPAKLDTSKAPTFGPNDAGVRVVEFYDYGCSHCAEFLPQLDAVQAKYEGKISVTYMMYPLGAWPNSKSAAQAALAAHQQGKFKEMHHLLFAKAHKHAEEDVMGYAKELGLDMAKFTADYKAFASQVDSDHAQGQAAGVTSTPSIFLNDRKWEGIPTTKYLGMAIEEEQAVNR